MSVPGSATAFYLLNRKALASQNERSHSYITQDPYSSPTLTNVSPPRAPSLSFPH